MTQENITQADTHSFEITLPSGSIIALRPVTDEVIEQTWAQVDKDVFDVDLSTAKDVHQRITNFLNAVQRSGLYSALFALPNATPLMALSRSSIFTISENPHEQQDDDALAVELAKRIGNFFFLVPETDAGEVEIGMLTIKTIS